MLHYQTKGQAYNPHICLCALHLHPHTHGGHTHTLSSSSSYERVITSTLKEDWAKNSQMSIHIRFSDINIIYVYILSSSEKKAFSVQAAPDFARILALDNMWLPNFFFSLSPFPFLFHLDFLSFSLACGEKHPVSPLMIL